MSCIATISRSSISPPATTFVATAWDVKWIARAGWQAVTQRRNPIAFTFATNAALAVVLPGDGFPRFGSGPRTLRGYWARMPTRCSIISTIGVEDLTRPSTESPNNLAASCDLVDRFADVILRSKWGRAIDYAAPAPFSFSILDASSSSKQSVAQPNAGCSRPDSDITCQFLVAATLLFVVLAELGDH